MSRSTAWSRIPLVTTLLLGLASLGARADDPFLVPPYLQPGDRAAGAPARERLTVLWHVADEAADWELTYRAVGAEQWVPAEVSVFRRVAVPGVAPFRVLRAVLSDLEPGLAVEYRTHKAGQLVFTAKGKALSGPGRPQRFVVLGDCGAGTPEQREVAFQVHEAHPDYLVITGDIVYSRGRISEYRARFDPVYNATTPSPQTGSPLLRTTLFFPAPGNHDLSARDLAEYPDGQAYFLYWDLPLNGPRHDPQARGTPQLEGPEPTRAAFRQAAGPAFPRMANYSFDAGDAHWLILDSNPYVDWNDPDLVAWIKRDLTAAQDKSWRFVAFHHPGFNSSKAHFNEQRTRLLAPLFERLGVAIVFAGHVHNYQRSYPLTFLPDGPVEPNGHVNGTWALDRDYDGQTRRRPKGVIYLVTGAGGARLYNPEQQDDPASWQPFTQVFRSQLHSFTVAELAGPTLTVRQLSKDGLELDRFVIDR